MSSTKSPFKEISTLRRDISNFLSAYRSVFTQDAKRTSAYFEIAVYNDVVKFYENNSYKVQPRNLKNNVFVYALSPNAKPKNCSYFSAERQYANGDIHKFEIRHNVRIQSAHDDTVYFSPDYAVINHESIQKTKLKHYYNSKADYFFVEAKNVQTFAETKHYNPSPELVLNFIGLVNEVYPEVLENNGATDLPKHGAPTLFVSGVGSVSVGNIAKSLRKRYQVNVLLGLFSFPSQFYSKQHQRNITKIGTR